MGKLVMLIVTVLGAGGPHGVAAPPLARVEVRAVRVQPGAARRPHLVAAHGRTDSHGRYATRLRRGTYLVEAERDGQACQVRSYTQTRHVGRLTLRCAIK